MKEKIESVFEAVIFSSRWIQAPLYAGLIVSGVLYADRFTKGLIQFCLTIKRIGVSRYPRSVGSHQYQKL